MSDFTIHVKSDGKDWIWFVEVKPGENAAGLSRRITDVEDDARAAIIKSGTNLRFAGFTTDVILDNPYVPITGTPAVICDIDGTLAERAHRGPYDFDKVETDELNRVVAEVLDLYSSFGYTIILLSGRQEEYRAHTERWLDKHCVVYDHLFMRPAGDRRSDDIVKLELFDNHVRGRFNVTHVLDDRDRCVYLWRKLGFPCWQVNPGNF